jgi:hypothetical protein
MDNFAIVSALSSAHICMVAHRIAMFFKDNGLVYFIFSLQMECFPPKKLHY